MRLARSMMLAIAATLVVSGCRAWDTGSLAPTPRPLAGRTFDIDEFVAEHNRNADRIQTLEAKMSIRVKSRLMHGGADGRLAMERPRNFKLEILSSGNVKADIGSNDEEFWFWMQNDEKRLYWCNYDEVGSSALAPTYQPDWIIDALGLKPISSDEAAKIKSRAGDLAGTTALVFPPTRTGVETSTRMMLVTNQTRRVKQHRLYQGSVPSSRSLLAQADVIRFAELDTDTGETSDAQRCYLPERVVLDWKQDQLSLDVSLKKDPDGAYEVKVNQFDSSRSAALFVEPSVEGHQRVNLAEISRGQRRDSRAIVHETLPPPSSRARAKLGRPTSDPDDTTMAPRRKSTAAPSTVLGSAISPLEDLVTAPLPVSPGSSVLQSAGGVSPRDALYQLDR